MGFDSALSQDQLREHPECNFGHGVGGSSQHANWTAMVQNAAKKIGEIAVPQPEEIAIRNHKFHVVTLLFHDSEKRWNPKAGQDRKETGLWLLPLGLSATVYVATLLDGYDTWQSVIEPDLWRYQQELKFEFVPIPNPRRAQECLAYTTYIIENYHKLPNHVVFLHGYPVDHNPYLLEQLQTLLDKDLPVPDFLHLNSESVLLRCQRYTRNTTIIRHLGLQANATETCYQPKYCCSQFVVAKEAILKRSLHFYRMLRKLTMDNQDCSQMEHLWHVVFGHAASFDGLSIKDLLHPQMLKMITLNTE